MKTYILILLHIISFNILGQLSKDTIYYADIKKFKGDSLITISQPDFFDLYRGYKNKIEIGYKSGCEFQIAIDCEDCDTVYHLGRNKFVVVPGSTKWGYIEVYKMLNDSNYQLISIKEYVVRNLPTPTIHLGSSYQEDPVHWENARYIYATYDSAALYYHLSISDWTIIIGRRHFSGTGNAVTSEVQERIKKMREGKKIKLSVKVIGENGEEIIIKTFFTKASNKRYKGI
jgi:hypothetical protein